MVFTCPHSFSLNKDLQVVCNSSIFQFFEPTNNVVICLDFLSTKRALWLVDSWSLAPDQIQMYPDRVTIGLLQLAITWYKIRHTGGQAHLKKETWTSEAWLAFVLMSQCGNNNELALPAWRILYHVIVSCKRPINQLLPVRRAKQHVISAWLNGK